MLYNKEENGLRALGKVWLVDYGGERGWRRLWRRFLPRRRQVGTLPDGTAVWLLEAPWSQRDWGERATRWLTRRLQRLERAERQAGGEFRLGLPLALAGELAAVYPEVLAAGRLLAARALVQKLPSLKGREVGLLGLNEAWQGFLAGELLNAGARVALAGGFAERLAAEYWRQGVALPVLSARKLLQSCETVILLKDSGAAEKLRNERLVPFREQQVFVSGRFSGRFQFGMFPAGMAAAMLQ